MNSDEVSATEAWFLQRGVPAVLPASARWRQLWSRSASALAGYAAFVVAATTITVAAGGHAVDIDDNPSLAEWLIIAILLAAVPTMFLTGWSVSRIGSRRGRRLAALLAVGIAVGADLVGPPLTVRVTDVVTTAAVVAAVLALTGLGVGSVLGWALRLTVTRLAAARFLVIRALPVLLLTFLVFFNSSVWLMATNISRGRLWAALLFLGLIAATFAVSGMLDRVRPIVDADPPDGHPQDVPLRRAERLNVLFVLVTTQLIQLVIVAVVTAALFFVLGLILLSPEVLAEWTRTGSADGTILGMTLPVPQALIHVTMFLAALTFMYVSARAVGDGEYRSDFLDPLVADLQLTLSARTRYRRLVETPR